MNYLEQECSILGSTDYPHPVDIDGWRVAMWSKHNKCLLKHTGDNVFIMLINGNAYKIFIPKGLRIFNQKTNVKRNLYA